MHHTLTVLPPMEPLKTPPFHQGRSTLPHRQLPSDGFQILFVDVVYDQDPIKPCNFLLPAESLKIHTAGN